MQRLMGFAKASALDSNRNGMLSRVLVEESHD